MFSNNFGFSIFIYIKNLSLIRKTIQQEMRSKMSSCRPTVAYKGVI